MNLESRFFQDYLQSLSVFKSKFEMGSEDQARAFECSINERVQKSISDLLLWSKLPFHIQSAAVSLPTVNQKSINRLSNDQTLCPPSKANKNKTVRRKESKTTQKNHQNQKFAFPPPKAKSNKNEYKKRNAKASCSKKKSSSKLDNPRTIIVDYPVKEESDDNSEVELKQSTTPVPDIRFSLKIFETESEATEDELGNFKINFDPISSDSSESDSSDDDCIQDTLLNYLNSKENVVINNEILLRHLSSEEESDGEPSHNNHQNSETAAIKHKKKRVSTTKLTTNKKRKTRKEENYKCNNHDEKDILQEIDLTSMDDYSIESALGTTNTGVKEEPKKEEDYELNKRSGTKRLRFHPARKRNYDYRKEDWTCPICDTVVKYGSRFLHTKLKHPGIYLCKICPKTFKKQSDFENHLKTHGNQKKGRKFECHTCTKSFCFETALERHIAMDHSSPKYNCAICDAPFFSTSALSIHYRNDHKTGEEDKLFECPQCNKSYKTSGSLRIHKLSHGVEKPFNCEECGLGFTRKNKFEVHKITHVRKSQGVPKTPIKDLKCSHIKPTLKGVADIIICETCGHVCEFCSYVFQSHQQFTAHTHNNFCALCVKKYPNEIDYRLHVAYHEPEHVIQYRCEICKFGFPGTNALNVHSQKVHRLTLKEIEFPCKICDKVFKIKQRLKMHMTTHEKVKKYGCPWCPSESFDTVVLLNYHLMKIHTKEKPHKCDECKKSFVRMTDLTAHRLTHETKGTFSCSICDLKLKSKRNLRLHMEIHSDTKKHECNVCNKKFRQKCYLKVHKALHSSDVKPFPCIMCEKGYLTKRGLEEHLAGAHKIKRNDVLKCSKCEKEFLTKDGLAGHLRDKNCGVRMGKKNKNNKTSKSLELTLDKLT